MDFLTVVAPDGDSSRHDLTGPGARIGRASGNDLVLRDLNISRVHAEIVRRPDGFYLLDSGGKNGTFLNDRKVSEPALLRPGDRLRLGSTTIIFNGAPESPVEWSDRPLMIDGGTRILPVGDPSARLGIPHVSDALSTEREAPRSAARGSGDLGIFIEADKELVFHRPLADLLETIMDLARRALPFERGLLMLLENDRLVPQVVRLPPDEAGRPISVSRTITERVLKKHESVLTSDAQVDFKGGESVEGLQVRSVACVPLWNNREVIGLIYVDSRHRAGLFTEDNLRVLTHLANVAAVKIEHARLFEQVVAAERMEQEMERAAEIQNHLLPGKGPAIEGYQIYGSSVPCRAVGGDYYDYIELPGGRYGLALGDVAGKGLPAALLMCSVQASLRALSDLDLTPDETLSRLNRLLTRSVPSNRFVTLFYGILDPVRHTLSYANAGQNPPLVLRGSATPAHRLAQTGRPLGLFESSRYGTDSIPLHVGDSILAYSDGATEEVDPSGAEFGEERLIEALLRGGSDAPSAIVQRITAALLEHQAGSPRHDDMTLVVLRRDT